MTVAFDYCGTWTSQVLVLEDTDELVPFPTVQNCDRAIFSQIAVQTLVIAGAQDQGTPLAMSQTLCEKISNAQLIVLEDASHLSAIEQPEAFAKAALQFIADL